MNARPYIFGCLCLVGANGTAAASDIDLTGGLLSMSGAVSSSSFESSSSRSSQSSRDSSGDAISSRAANASPRASVAVPVPPSTDVYDDSHDSVPPSRSTAPNWQSMLPGSIL